MQPVVPTSRRVLIAAGATPARLDAELRAGRSIAMFRGVHVAAADQVGWLTRVRAALATQDSRSVLTHTTAAAVHGLRWLPAQWSDPSGVVHVAVARDDGRRHRDGVRLHRRLLEPVDVTCVGGLRSFTATRTLVELARDPKVPPLLVVQIIDGALRDGRTTQPELLACLARMPGERGVARARRLVLRSREGVDSPKETQMRLLLEDGGITGLDVDIEISDDDGHLLARGDLGFKRLLIWGEYDGYDAHRDRPAFRSDRVGDRWLSRRGWHVMRFVDEDLRRPEAVRREWKQAMADAPARIAALPASRSPEIAVARAALGFD